MEILNIKYLFICLFNFVQVKFKSNNLEFILLKELKAKI